MDNNPDPEILPLLLGGTESSKSIPVTTKLTIKITPKTRSDSAKKGSEMHQRPPDSVPETLKRHTIPGAEAAPTKAVWTDTDTFGLLEFLIDNKARAGDGGSYPMMVYNEAAIECNKLHSQGAKKTGTLCKNKFSTFLHPIFKTCLTIDACSGLGGFDTKTGAHVTPESESVWEDLVKKNPTPFWDKMKEILGSPPPRDHHVFRASQTPREATPPPDAPQSLYWDIEDPNANLLDGSQDTIDSGLQSEDDIINDNEPQTPKTQLAVWASKKREATGPPPSTAKKPRLSGGALAIDRISSSMDHFTNAMTDVFALETTAQSQALTSGPAAASAGTPRSNRQALALAQIQEEELTAEECIDLVEMFERDSTLVESYLALTVPKLRETWIKRKLVAFYRDSLDSH
ncbi:hypothetical protein DFJ43DRAFT_1035475 [Lentinula guzmanii]|uniref:Myb/SANT-like domain-containing protein n=1 Tax=Lentinula guzmanii TaxID=2804957 RepID=A0AA38N5F9_9AGAR|nr:hypothetical protein DFJ43DRAFT_1035475 [Lentinula guzmanii]